MALNSDHAADWELRVSCRILNSAARARSQTDAFIDTVMNRKCGTERSVVSCSLEVIHRKRFHTATSLETNVSSCSKSLLCANRDRLTD